MRSSLLMMEGCLRSIAHVSAGSAAAETSPTGEGSVLSFLAQETARLQRLLGDASKFHRILRDLPAMETGPIDLVGVIKDSISGVTALAVPRGIDVRYHGPSTVAKVRGNYDKVLQVLYNLLLNALKATPKGGRIAIELETAEPEILVSVIDTGRGMSRDRLGEIMGQAQRPELFLSQKGTRVGLGLAIAFQFVRAHRGRFFAESRTGVGSRFTFTLPLESETEGRRRLTRSSVERLTFEGVEEETT
jgi:signal transduction histidine kinase